jgi:hypothetical protein
MPAPNFFKRAQDDPEGIPLMKRRIEKARCSQQHCTGARPSRRGGGNPVATAKVRAAADRHALNVLPMIMEIRSTGKTSFGEISAELNNRGVLSARCRQWYPMTVSNLLARARRLL